MLLSFVSSLDVFFVFFLKCLHKVLAEKPSSLNYEKRKLLKSRFRGFNPVSLKILFIQYMYIGKWFRLIHYERNDFVTLEMRSLKFLLC